jgi:4-diphosphocytidyl-2-C-methyl-D-erythritol kinase
MTELRLAQELHLRAPAKINLGLEITGRRPDGYHEIVTILQTIDLFDDIVLTPSDRFRYSPDPRIPPQDDLILRTLELVHLRLGLSLRARVQLMKRIPLSAGLGGGSSDAGTLLAAIGELAGVPTADVVSLAAELGSDVPFFLRGGTALATGTGTDLKPLPLPSKPIPLLLVIPEVGIPRKTATLYASLTAADFSDGRATRELADQIRQGKPIDVERLCNAFARPLAAYEPIQVAREALERAGATVVLPSGAGPSLLGVFPSREQAIAALTDWPPSRRFLPRLVAARRSRA